MPDTLTTTPAAPSSSSAIPTPLPVTQAPAEGVVSTAPATAAQPAPTTASSGGKKPPRRIDPKKAIIGCLGLAGILFVILIFAMIMGLTAGESVIRSFGFDPTSFKNWTVNLVSFVFGTISLIFVIALVRQIVAAALAGSGEHLLRIHALRRAAVHGVLLIVTITGWYVAFTQLNQFLSGPSDFAADITVSWTDATGAKRSDTLGLTSPIVLHVSGELVAQKYAKFYDVVSYEWDKDSDGVVDATGERTQIYYQDGGKQNGRYTMTLIATLQPIGGGPMEQQTYTKAISIDKREMYGEIVASRESGDVPLRVDLDASQIADPDGARITNYAWDIDGDKKYDFDGPMYSRVEATFDTLGEHVVTVRVRSSDFADNGVDAEEKEFTKKIVVHEPGDLKKADAVIGTNVTEGLAPLTVRFDAGESGALVQSKISRYEWNVNDGAAIFYGRANSYTFEKAGTYAVMLTVTYDSGATRTATTTIRVDDPTFAPKAVIQTDPPSRAGLVEGPAPLVITFDASGSKDADNNIVSYAWDFDNDGTPDAEGSNVKQTFREAGKRTVRLRVTDADGATSDTTVAVNIDAELPTVAFGASTLAGPAPLTVSFDASGSRMPGKKIVSYEWQFGDSREAGLLYQKAQASHTFPRSGEYLVHLTLHADDGTTTDSQLKVIATQPALAARITASRITGKAPLAVSFDSAGSTGEVVSYRWSFGDGTTSTDVRPVHVFQKTGNYTVTLQVTDRGNNTAIVEQTISVQ